MEEPVKGLREAVAQNNHIVRRSSFFGLIKHLTYEPTDSRLQFTRKNYSNKTGEELKRLFTEPDAAIKQQSLQGYRIAESANGGYLLDICRSADRRFCAIQLLQFFNLDYNALTDVRFFEDDSAEAICRIPD